MAAILVIFLLILLNGVFAMSEIAMVSSRKSRLKASAKKGDKAAKKALELANNPSKFLSTIQIGITLIGIFTGIYSGEEIEDDLEIYLRSIPLVSAYSDKLSIGIIVVVLTFFSLVLGELVPKRIGLTMPETIIKALSYPMYIISIIAAPFIWLLSRTTDFLITLLNIKKNSDSHVTEEEIKAIIREATETGAVQEIEQDIMENVFHLGDRKINTLMTHRTEIDWINILDPVENIKKQLTVSVHKSFPVCREDLDHVAGIIYSKDLLNSLLVNQQFEIERHLKAALFLSEKSTAFNALEKLRKSKQHLALVVDEYGSVKGLLTMNDLVDSLLGDFVEDVHEKKEIVPRDDGSFLVDAALPLPEFARYFEIDISDDESFAQINTLGGLAYNVFKKIPNTGNKFNWKNLSFEIVDMDGRRIDKVLVKRLIE